MRRFLAISIATAAFAAAGCGDDPSEVAEDARNQAVEQADADDLASATRALADQIAQAADELAENPDANVDEQLQSAEERAGELAGETQRELDEREPDLASALREANRRLEEAAERLRDADSADDVRQVLEQDLGTASQRLADAERLTGVDAGQELEQARERLERLRDDLGG